VPRLPFATLQMIYSELQSKTVVVKLLLADGTRPQTSQLKSMNAGAQSNSKYTSVRVDYECHTLKVSSTPTDHGDGAQSADYNKNLSQGESS